MSRVCPFCLKTEKVKKRNVKYADNSLAAPYASSVYASSASSKCLARARVTRMSQVEVLNYNLELDTECLQENRR